MNSNQNNSIDEKLDCIDIDISNSSQVGNLSINQLVECELDCCITDEDENWDTSEDLSQKEAVTFPPTINDVFNGYKLVERVKNDINCVVFVCHKVSQREIKLIAKIAINKEESKLRKEYRNYLLLEGGDCVPKLIDNFWWKVLEHPDWDFYTNWGMIVIEKFNNYFSFSSKRFSNQKLKIEKLIPMALQQISLLEYVHSKGLTHRGVKPDNFVVSTRDETKFYIIDFNRSKSYLTVDNKHCGYQRDSNLPTGNPLFHSLNYHNGIRRTRRDDMESLGLCWVYQLKGRLPWSDVVKPVDKYKHNDYIKKVGHRVRGTTIEQLCEDLPENFVKYFKMCRELGFKDKPNYDEMRRLIRESFDPNIKDNTGISDDSGILS